MILTDTFSIRSLKEIPCAITVRQISTTDARDMVRTAVEDNKLYNRVRKPETAKEISRDFGTSIPISTHAPRLDIEDSAIVALTSKEGDVSYYLVEVLDYDTTEEEEYDDETTLGETTI